MTDKQIIKTTAEFTKGIIGKQESKNQCYKVCWALQGYLSICGLETELIVGEIYIKKDIYEHMWLKLSDGRILDPTADQFNSHNIHPAMPKTFLGQKPEWYKIVKK